MPKAKLTRAALADALGITSRHVYLLQRQGMPVQSVAVARRWRERNILTNGDDIAGLRAAILKKRGELLDIEIGERSRALIDTTEAERVMVGAATACRERLLAVRKHLRAHHPALPAEVFEEIERLHGQALSLLSRDLRAAADSREPPA